MHYPLNFKLKSVIDISLSKRIVHQCDFTYMGQIFKALYLLIFYSFLCLSNIVPYTVAQFSPPKHLPRGDVILRPDKLVLILKCSKTMQSNNLILLITVPRIPNSSICPVAAINSLLDLTSRGANLPLFQFKVAPTWLPLTDNRVR